MWEITSVGTMSFPWGPLSTSSCSSSIYSHAGLKRVQPGLHGGGERVSGSCANSQTTPKSALKCTGSPETTPFKSQAIPGAGAGGKDSENLKLSEEQEAGDSRIDQSMILTNRRHSPCREQNPQ